MASRVLTSTGRSPRATVRSPGDLEKGFSAWTGPATWTRGTPANTAQRSLFAVDEGENATDRAWREHCAALASNEEDSLRRIRLEEEAADRTLVAKLFGASSRRRVP